MKAARLYGVRDLRVEEVPDPEPGPEEVLIRIQACGVCPSDLRAYLGTRPASNLPRTPGHEWAGVVVAVGSAVTEVKVGDRVVADWRVVCGRCENCWRGVFNYCTNLGRVQGGFAEYGLAPARNVRRLPDHVSFEEAAFCEPLACCINGSQAARIGLGDDVVIVGCGPIGLQHLQLARLQGARVLAVDLDERRLEAARMLGAHDVIHARTVDPVRAVKERTNGRGADAVIIAVGDPQAIAQGLEMGALNARIQIFAGTYPPQALPVDPNLIHYRQLVVTGSHDFTPHQFTTALKLISYGMVNVRPLITHRFSLEEIVAAFETTAQRRGLKSMVLLSA